MSEKLKVSPEKIDEAKKMQLVKFSGDFDKAGFSDVRSELNELVKSFDQKYLIFDFGGLEFINSEGIGYLLEVNNMLSKNDKVLGVVGVNRYIADIFDTIGIKDIVKIGGKAEDIIK